MSPLDSYIDSSCENTAYKPTLKKRKIKNRVLAVILGLFFGPFGMLYFGWAVLLTTLITYIVVFLLAALFSPFRIPTQGLGFILNLFFGFWGFMLASLHNELTEADDSTRLAGMNLVGMNGWLIRVILVTTGLYSMVMFFSEGRWIVAILTPILFIPIAIWCVESMFTFLTAIVLGFFTRSEHKENTHYQEAIKTDKQFNESLALASDSTQENPSENRRYAQAYCASGDAHRRKLEQDQAIFEQTKAVEANPESPGVGRNYFLRGTAYYNKGQYDRAIDDYSNAIEHDAMFLGWIAEPGHIGWGDETRRQIQLNPETEEAFRLDVIKNTHQHQRYPFDYYYRASAHYAKGEYDKAILDYTKTIEIDPDMGPAHYFLAEAYLKTGDRSQAISWLREAARLGDERAKDKLVEIGEMILTDKKMGATSKEHAKWLVLALLVVVLIAIIVVRFSNTLAVTRADIDIGEANSNYNRGFAYESKGQLDRAISDFTRAIEINPELAEAYYNRGNAYDKKGEYEQAISDFNKAIEMNPKLAEAYYNRGSAHEDKGKYDQAISDFNKAIEINPKLAEAYNNRGIAYNSKGEHEQAISDFNKAIEINPKLAEDYYNRGNRQPTYGDSHVTENGSYYGQISENTGRPKTVHVRGYYRKDGTYVRSHYRSPPGR